MPTTQSSASLDTYQEEAVCRILRKVNDSKERNYFFLTGGPGTGKTYATRELVKRLTSHHDVIILSWNALTSRALGGQTVMGFFGLTFEDSGIVGDNAYMRDPHELARRMLTSIPSENRRTVASHKAVLIVDEVMCLHDTIIDAMSQAFRRIRQQMGSDNLPFGNVPTVFVGDVCQFGPVELCEQSKAYPKDTFPTYSFWHSNTWADMKPDVLYLTSFHRGSDSGYLSMLEEIRKQEHFSPGVPMFSKQSLDVLESIRDRDGGVKQPNFDHTCICLRNREADQYNTEYLDSLPGDAVTFEAEDTEFGALGVSFNIYDVDKMGFRSKIKVKVGCRVMTTVNDPNNGFVNGSMGKVESIRGPTTSSPAVIVRFDEDPHRGIEVKPHTFNLLDNGCIRFRRCQIPIVVAACLTAHKTIGMTLNGAWCRLPFGGVPRDKDDDVREFWSRGWLRGAAYTILSRVGTRQKIRVHPLRHSKNRKLGDVLPIFYMDDDALEFDQKCKRANWLSKSDHGSNERSPIVTSSSDEGQPAHAPADDLTLLREEILEKFSDIRLDLEAHSARFFLSQQYAAAAPANKNPVLHCWMNPRLRQAVQNLPIEIQGEFYRQVSEELNLTSLTSEDRILEIARLLPTNGDHRTHAGFPTTVSGGGRESNVMQFDHAGEPAGNDASRDTCSEVECASPIEEEGSNLAYNDDRTESSDAEYSPSEGESSHPDPEAPQPDGSATNIPEFDGQAFLIMPGELHEVVAEYLQGNPHFALEHGYSLKNLRQRNSCRLECRRAISKRYEGQEIIKRHKPDWRLWEEFTCPLSKISVKEIHGRCFFFGVTSAEATQEQWRNHFHPYDTWKCRSLYVPPDIADDWCFWVFEDPVISLGELRSRSLQRNILGHYSASTTQFIASGGLSEVKKLQGIFKSIKENGKSGLSIRKFLEQVQSLMKDENSLREDMTPILTSLQCTDMSSDTSLDLQRKADDCVLLRDILCERQSEAGKMSSIKDFAAIFSSARMLGNITGATALGVDTTFNILYAKAVLGVVCNISRKGMAKPIAVALLQSESAPSMGHVLKVLKEASSILGLRDSLPTEIVMDGSSALHRAAVDTYGGEGSFTIQSCYFHVIQQARTVRGECGISINNWKKIRDDLETLADSWSREEWLRLRELFMDKWNEKISSQTTEQEKKALKEFFKRFGDYLDPTKWRSYWGTYAGQSAGPRTNNCVERFNRELKSLLIPRRRRITLSEFGALLKKPSPWASISQYGRVDVRGQVTSDIRHKAAEYYVTSSFAQVPRSWVSSYSRDTGLTVIQWVFVESSVQQGNMKELMKAPRNLNIKRFCASQYESLQDATDLKNKFSLVSYQRTADTSVDPPEGPWCSCRDWTGQFTCAHVVCIGFSMGFEAEEGAMRDWATALARFSRPEQRKNKKGVISDQTVPDNVRYGLGVATRPKRLQKSAGVPASAHSNDGSLSPQSQDDNPSYPHDTMDPAGVEVNSSPRKSTDGEGEQGLENVETRQDPHPPVLIFDEIVWPPLLPTDQTGPFCGCQRGNNEAVGMIKCSRLRCPHRRWWHIDCATVYAAATGTVSGHEQAANNDRRWYCFTCRGRSWRSPFRGHRLRQDKMQQ